MMFTVDQWMQLLDHISAPFWATNPEQIKGFYGQLAERGDEELIQTFADEIAKAVAAHGLDEIWIDWLDDQRPGLGTKSRRYIDRLG